MTDLQERDRTSERGRMRGTNTDERRNERTIKGWRDRTMNRVESGTVVKVFHIKKLPLAHSLTHETRGDERRRDVAWRPS